MLKRKPSIVIANLIRGFNGYLIELANKINIPTLSISHGTLSKGLNKESIYFQKKISEELIFIFICEWRRKYIVRENDIRSN